MEARADVRAVAHRDDADLQALASVPTVEVRISRVADWSGGYIPYARVEHCKYAVADSSWLWLGTSNWEPSYFLTTRNVGLTVRHGGLARSARRVFEKDWTASSALQFGPQSHLAQRPHGQRAPEGAKVSGAPRAWWSSSSCSRRCWPLGRL